MEKKIVSRNFRNGYILALDSMLVAGKIDRDEKHQFIEAFDKMYQVKSKTHYKKI